jgi:hypothetical protein
LGSRPCCRFSIYIACCNLFIRQHGAGAEIEAARKTDLMLERGHREGVGCLDADKAGDVDWQAQPSGPLH